MYSAELSKPDCCRFLCAFYRYYFSFLLLNDIKQNTHTIVYDDIPSKLFRYNVGELKQQNIDADGYKHPVRIQFQIYSPLSWLSVASRVIPNGP